MENDSKAGEFTPPPLSAGESIFCVMAARDGQLYAAPLGTPYDLDASESWLKVDSLGYLASLLGVEWTAR